MKKVLLFAAACLLSGAIPVSGAQVIVNFMTDAAANLNNRVFADESGTPLPDGSLIRVGTFTDGLTTNRAILESGTFAQLDMIFTPLAEDAIRPTGVGVVGQSVPPLVPAPTPDILVVNGTGTTGLVPGAALGSIAAITSPPPGIGDTDQLYLWVLTTSDLSAHSAPGVHSGIFTSQTSPEWKFKASNGIATNALRGDDVGLEAIRGMVTDGVLLVPEPSTALLGGIFALLALCRRRR